MNFGTLQAASGFWEYWAITISAIFVIVNPLTTAFMFMMLVPFGNVKERNAVAKRAVITSTIVLLVFVAMGGLIFKLFGITLYAFRIAGGIILFGIAMKMLGTRDEHENVANSKQKGDVAIIPLAIPFISGPGSIATVMILTSEAPSVYHLIILIAAIVITTTTCYFTMIYSDYIVKLIGNTGKDVVTRIFGLILAVVAVQFVLNGIIEVYKEMTVQ
jgi:multiple antibiotic resistance protein